MGAGQRLLVAMAQNVGRFGLNFLAVLSLAAGTSLTVRTFECVDCNVRTVIRGNCGGLARWLRTSQCVQHQVTSFVGEPSNAKKGSGLSRTHLMCRFNKRQKNNHMRLNFAVV